MKGLKIILVMSLALFLFAGFTPELRNARSIVNEMSLAIDQATRLSFTMKMEERINGEFVKSKVSVKLNTDPLQIYIYSFYPNQGAEILYTPTADHKKALVNPNGFPFFNVSFSPFHSQMRKNKHHTILSMGFGMLGEIIDDVLKSKEFSFDNYFSYTGEVGFDGKKCYKIILTDDDFSFVPYTMDRDETLFSLAKRKNISEYLIKEKNGMSGYGKVKKGTELLIPTTYAKITELLIDQSTMLPLVQIMHDEKGIFERYEYYDLKVNPEFDALTFSKDNKAYGF